MKILIVLASVIIFWSCITTANQLENKIKEDYEYINIYDEIYSNNEYTSNFNNTYFFFGGLRFFEIKEKIEIQQIKEQLDLSKQDIFFLLKWDEKLLVQKEENKIELSNSCTTINDFQDEIFSAYENSFLIPNHSDKFFVWQWEPTCYLHKDNLYLPNNNFAQIDMDFFVNNYEKVKESIDKISKEYKKNNENKKKLIYKYIIDNTDYDYDILDQLDDLPSDMDPWRVSSFFQWKNLVCDGYVKTFLLISRLLGIEWERIVWQVQPTSQTDVRLEDYLHSWIKINWKYYDPTFDDWQMLNNDQYFGVWQTCLNLTHYKERTGWYLFKDFDDRFDYISNNTSHLIENCPWILYESLSQGSDLIEFVNYYINNYNDLEKISNFLCEYLNICDLPTSNKEKLVKELWNYKIEFQINWQTKEYNLKEKITLDETEDNWKDQKDKKEKESKEESEKEDKEKKDTDNKQKEEKNQYSKYNFLTERDKERVKKTYQIIQKHDDWTYKQQIIIFLQENRNNLNEAQTQMLIYLLDQF